MPEDNVGISLGETEFSNLCSHYKDTYEIHLKSIKQRDTLFYALLIILALFSLQVTSADLVNSVLSSYANTKLGISIDRNSNLFGTLLWFLLFGFSSKYYQTVTQIEKQYDYIHHLEKIINSRYAGTKVFTREGKSYLSDYPLFSNWMWLLYTLAFPSIILLCITIRIHGELENPDTLSISLLPSFIAYLLVGTSTILYIGKLHSSFLRKLLKTFFLGYHKIQCVFFTVKAKCWFGNSNTNKPHPNLLIEEWLEKINQGAKKMANDENNQEKIDKENHTPNDITIRSIKEAQANLTAIRNNMGAEMRLPNKDTIKAMTELKNGKGIRFESFDELIRSLEDEENIE